MTKYILLKTAIQNAGGQQRVAEGCGIKQPSVAAWLYKGLPRTEWTGETSHAEVIVALARENGFSYRREDLINRNPS